MTDVALREFLEHKIEALDKRIDERLCAQSKALSLQAREYERRLEQLNHEQARLAADRERFMPREIADQRQKDYEDWRASIDKTLATGAGASKWETVILSAAISAAVFMLSRLIQ